jgi:drug/metabolite transporter (DMT)-like permease
MTFDRDELNAELPASGRWTGFALSLLGVAVSVALVVLTVHTWGDQRHPVIALGVLLCLAAASLTLAFRILTNRRIATVREPIRPGVVRLLGAATAFVGGTGLATSHDWGERFLMFSMFGVGVAWLLWPRRYIGSKRGKHAA